MNDPRRFFDDIEVGEAYESPGRTVTETDNVMICALTHNPQPLHLDHQAAAQSEFGKPLVNSVYTFGLMVGVSVADIADIAKKMAPPGFELVVSRADRAALGQHARTRVVESWSVRRLAGRHIEIYETLLREKR